MILEIDFPEHVTRKMRALNLLMGGAAEEVDGLLVSLVDAALSQAIIERVQDDSGVQLAPLVPQPRLAPSQTAWVEQAPPKAPRPRTGTILRGAPVEAVSDPSGIGQSLGDDAKDDEDEDAAFFLQGSADVEEVQQRHRRLQQPTEPYHGKATAMSESDFESDLQIQDPEHEAIAVPPPANRPGVAPENQFAELVGIPAPQQMKAIKVPDTPRRKARQRPLPKRGIVQGFGDNTPSDPSIM